MILLYPLIIFLHCCSSLLHAGAPLQKNNPKILVSRNEAIPATAKKLMASYPGQITGFANNRLIFSDNSTMVWDDGIKNKSMADILDHPDLKDMFSQAYTKGDLKLPIAKSFDPGRIRNEEFFKKMYGADKSKVQENLTVITWCPKLIGKNVRVTKVNGVDKKMEQVSRELDEHPEWKVYLENIGGTFNWRNIKGTNRLSTHSFGTTVDINGAYSDYWQWACKCVEEEATFTYINRIPQGIVDIFEKNGFIWGGKWYHFDSMHFEYRPELLP